MSSHPEFEKLCKIFQSESIELDNSIQQIEGKPEKTLSDIVEVYYQAIKVGSMAKSLKANYQVEHERIDDVEKNLVEKFNTSFHPTILSYLTDLVTSQTDNLRILAKESVQKSKEQIEEEAKSYKELREIMSTKEFVEQYQNGLKDD